MIIVYTLENCPHCEEVKAELKSCGIPFVERDMQTAESITELRVNQCFAVEAPVVQDGDECYEYSHIHTRPDFFKNLVR